jgi:6-phosphogluconate dehydrogenase
MIGLGRMGANMARRLMKAGHPCAAYDLNADAVTLLAAEGALPGTSLADLVAQLDTPRVVWIMVPAAFVGATVDQLVPLMAAGDIIVDGGNSFYRDDVDRSEKLAEAGIHYVDVGTSGGVFGLERGYCMMVGGDGDAVEVLAPLLDALAPGVEVAPRTPGRDGALAPAEKGWLHCGPSGAGHFVKMVHNGIEYGLMAAYAEGFNVLRGASAGLTAQAHSAETTPLRDAKYFRYELDTAAIAEVWRRGSVVTSWLLDLTAIALNDDPDLAEFQGRVSDSGEGRWTIQAAIEAGVPVPVLSSALYERFASRGDALFADKLLSAMRKQFGGHHELTVDPTPDVPESKEGN